MMQCRSLQVTAVLIALVGAGVALWFALHQPEPAPIQPVLAGPAPVVDPPQPAVQVITYYPGMPASSIEKTITNRIERWVNQAPDCVRVESHSVAGVSIVRVYFRRGTDLGAALTAINSLALGTLPTLPPNTLPSVVIPFDPAARLPLGLLTVGSSEFDEAHLKDIARIDVRNLLGSVPGCVAPVVMGGKDRTILLNLDPKRMQAHNLSPLDIVQALQKANMMVAPGSAYFGNNQVLLEANLMVDRIDELNDVPIRVKPEPTLFLRDVGQVTDSYAVQTARVRIDGRRGVCIPIFASPGQATAVRDGLTIALPGMQPRLPKGAVLQFLPLASDRRPNGDTGLVTISLRAPSNLRLDATEKRVAALEDFLKANIPAQERIAIVSELGMEADWSAIYTANAGEQDATIYLQLANNRSMRARDYAAKLRRLFQQDKRFADLQTQFTADGHEPPLNVRMEGGTTEAAMEIARKVRDRLRTIPGTADVWIVERHDAPYLAIDVDTKKAAAVGLTAQDVALQVMAAMNTDLSLNRNFWIAKTGNQFPVAVRYLEDPKAKLEDSLNILATGTDAAGPVKLGSLAALHRRNDAVEIDHVNLARIVNVRANVDGRSVADVAADIRKMLKEIQMPAGMNIALDVRSE